MVTMRPLAASGPVGEIEGEPPAQARDDGLVAKGAWWTVGVLTLLHSVSMLDRQVFNLLVDPIGKSLQINDFQLSLLSGFAFAVFYATFGIVFGWATDRLDRRGIVFVGVAFWSVATAACGLARNFWQFAFARFSVGAGEAALNPAAYSIISDLFPRARLSLAISIFTTGVMIGGIASKLFAATLMAILPDEGLVLPVLGHQEPWRIVFLALGLPGVLLAFLVWTFREPVRRQRMRDAGAAKAGAAFRFMKQRSGFYGWYFVGSALSAAANYAFAAWSPAFLMRTYNLTVSEVGFLMAPLMIVPQIGGLLLAGWLADRFFSAGRKDIHLRMIMVMGCVKAVIVVIAMTMHLPLLVTIGLLGLATFFSGFAGIAPAVLQLVTPNQYRGQVSASHLFVSTLIGMGFGPMIAGALTTFVFQDQAKVGWAIAVTFAAMQPFVLLALWRALRGVRAQVDESQQWASG